MRKRILTTAAVLAAVLIAAAPPGTRAAPSGQGEARRAERALQAALDLFVPPAADPQALRGAGGRPDATLVLRDLAYARRHLPPHRRRIAETLLARPTDGRRDPQGVGYKTRRSYRSCTRRVCVHYVRRTRDRPRLRDRRPRRGVPDYVDLVRRVMQREVWRRIVGRRGYRAPRPDTRSDNNGGDSRLDVYLADVGRYGLYGFCASDDPRLRRRRARAISAYCVLDDDYSRRQYPPGSRGRAALRVTAAHEFFHAVQFAYDGREDYWIMENTAVWMEDEVYDHIDDSLQFLRDSQITRPGTPLDLFDPNRMFHYGNFVLWRHLTEDVAAPALVREVWERLTDVYSVRGLEQALEVSGVELADALGSFAVANLDLPVSYEEGDSYQEVTGGVKLTDAQTVVDAPVEAGASVDHLAHAYRVFERDPGSGASQLRVEVRSESLPARAWAVVQTPEGASHHEVVLGDEGSGEAVVPFGPEVERVVVTLTNAGARYECWQGLRDYACRGRPLNDGVAFTVVATPLTAAPTPSPGL